MLYKLNVLNISFEKSRLKRRITWLQAGDKNTKIFHTFVEHCRNINSIWAMENKDGKIVEDQLEITQTVHTHFESYYSSYGNFSVMEQIKVIKEFPRLFLKQRVMIFSWVSLRQNLKV